MRKSMSLVSLLTLPLFFLISGWGMAAEHPGTSVVEHPGRAVSGDLVKKAIGDHVKAEEKANAGFFVLPDPELTKTWRLKLAKIHDPVRTFKKGDQTIYFACSDFKSADGKDVLDIDFWMVPDGKKMKVIDTKIHKLNGKPRFAYEGIEAKPIK